MGVFNDGIREKKSKKRGNPTSESKLAALRDLASRSKGVDWGDCIPTLLSGLICEVTRRGGMVSFSRSRDQSALGVVIFMDGDKESFWFGGGHDIEAEIEKLVVVIDTIPTD